MMVKIEPPDFETRKQIIRAKADGLNLRFEEEAVAFLGEKLCDNVRQIEGGLRKIKAYRDLSNMPLTLANIAKTIADIQTSETCAVVTPDTVVRYVCKYYGIDEQQIKSPHRSKNISEPRQIAIYLIRELTGLQLETIGKYFNRDHGTISSSIKKIQGLIAGKDRNMENILREIRMNIDANK